MSSRAIVSYDKVTDVIRLDIPHASPMMKPGPGQYYYVYQPMTLRGWECHPFSLGSWQTSSTSLMTSPTNTAPSSPMSDLTVASMFDKDIEKTITMNGTTLRTVSSSEELSALGSTTTSLTFWIRPYDGWTKRLRDSCIYSLYNSIRPHILIEGPYGHKVPLHTYDTVMLVCGGTGISAALPYILDHITRAAIGTTKTTSLKLVWTAKQGRFIRDLCEKELASALTRSDFAAVLSATQDTAGDLDEIKLAAPCQIQAVRPDVRSLVINLAKESHGSSVAVLVCGPTAMVDEVRIATQEALLETKRDVGYYEEAFAW
jgi:NAD(P)H-flavin reductase